MVGTFLFLLLKWWVFHFGLGFLVFADKMPNYCLFWCQIVEKIKKYAQKHIFLIKIFVSSKKKHYLCVGFEMNEYTFACKQQITINN